MTAATHKPRASSLQPPRRARIAPLILIHAAGRIDMNCDHGVGLSAAELAILREQARRLRALADDL